MVEDERKRTELPASPTLRAAVGEPFESMSVETAMMPVTVKPAGTTNASTTEPVARSVVANVTRRPNVLLVRASPKRPACGWVKSVRVAICQLLQCEKKEKPPEGGSVGLGVSHAG